MKLSAQAVAVLIIAVGSGLIVRSLFPKREVIDHPVVIRTEYDTVTVLDTLWRTKLVTETKWDTVYLERVVTAAPETLRICPTVRGLTALSVPNKTGDSTKAEGFTLRTRDSLILREPWQTAWYTPGPLKAVSLDTFPPRVAFWDPPKVVKGCGLLCKLSDYTIGAVVGRASCAIH